MSEPIFIALEGIDGSGKSSQARLLAENLTAAGLKVYLTYEPTGNFIGAIIRNILKGNARADERTIAGLFLADRLDHLLNEDYGLVKKLSEGYTVITDRYYFSSYAYHGTHMDIDWVIDANKMCAGILKPTINIFIDVSPETCMQRISAGRNNVERYETLENLRKVRGKYTEVFDKLKEAENIQIIDGERSMEEVADEIFNLTQVR